MLPATAAAAPPQRAVETKQEEGDDWLALVWDDAEEAALLTALLGAHYARMLRSVHLLLRAALPALDLPLAPDPAATRAILAEAGTRVARITETTRTGIRAALVEGQQRGYSARQIAQGVPADGYRGIAGLIDETWRGRALTIARTELQHAMLVAAQQQYAATGVVEALLVHDGMDFDEPCRARNGTVVPISARVELNHPNCTVRISPVIRAEALV
jgi:hypothetical protein